jgi:hypothetical protein
MDEGTIATQASLLHISCDCPGVVHGQGHHRFDWDCRRSADPEGVIARVPGFVLDQLPLSGKADRQSARRQTPLHD